MADSNAKELITLGERLFAKKATLDQLHQTLAEAFYPERANFTRSRTEGDEYADAMYESEPAQNRRDLAGAIGAILRPRGKEWFKPVPKETWRRTPAALRFADFARDQLRGQLYNETSKFQKTMTDADDDFVSFGNAIPLLTENPDRNGFMFELSHVRDNAWTTSRYGHVDCNHRKLRYTLRAMRQRWGEKAMSEAQLKTLEKSPYEEVEIRHVLMPVEDYEPYDIRKSKWRGKPFASVYINPDNLKLLEEGGYFEFPMLHRRWRVADDSVYGYSPASMLGLIDARVLQSQARVIMDAGELHVAPPLVAKKDAVLGGVKYYAGATTWLDGEYDERLGEGVRALDVGGDVRIGLDMKIDTRAILKAAWLLNKLNLPSDKDMTAYEVSERVAEYIRSAGPIFEPFEADNARTLTLMFKMGLRLGLFGAVQEIPPEVLAGEIEWEFDTPVQTAYKRLKVIRARETVEMIAPIAQIEPTIKDNFDFDQMARDTGESIGGEAGWLRPMEAVQQIRAGRDQQMAEMEKMQKADASLSLADKAASAGQKFAGASQALPLLQQLAQQSGLLPEGLAGLLGQAAGAAQGGAGGGGQGGDPAAAWPEPESGPFFGTKQQPFGTRFGTGFENAQDVTDVGAAAP